MIALASDDKSILLKQFVFKHLKSLGLACLDFRGDETADCRYPLEYAYKVMAAVTTNACERGIICCKKEADVFALANNIKGIRYAGSQSIFQEFPVYQYEGGNLLVLKTGMEKENVLNLLERWISSPYRESACQAQKESRR